MVLVPLDVESLGRQFAAGEPFPHVVLDQFVEPALAAEIAAAGVGHSSRVPCCRAQSLGYCPPP